MSLLAGLLLGIGCTAAPDVAEEQPTAAHPPEPAPHEGLDAFADAYRARLLARGDPACTWQHDRATARCPDGRRHDVPALWGIVSTATDPPSTARALLAMIDAPPPVADLDAVAPFIHLRPVKADDAPALPDGVARIPATPDGALHWVVELGLPGGIVPVGREVHAGWGVPDEVVLEAAGAHVDRVDPRPFWPLGPGIARARVGDGHDAARLLSAALHRLDFEPRRAAVVIDDALVVADAEHGDALRALVAGWGGPDPVLLRRDPPAETWAAWSP